MFYAILWYVLMSIMLFLLYGNWRGIRRIEKKSFFQDSFIEQSERHLTVMEQQVRNSEEEAAAGKMLAHQMVVMNAKLDAMHEDSVVQLNIMRQESLALKEELAFVKTVVLKEGRPEETDLDFEVVQNMKHEIVVTEESGDEEI